MRRTPPPPPPPQIHIYKWCLLMKWRRRRRWRAISWLGYFRKNKISKIPVHKDPIKRGTETDRQTDRQREEGRERGGGGRERGMGGGRFPGSDILEAIRYQRSLFIKIV